MYSEGEREKKAISQRRHQVTASATAEQVYVAGGQARECGVKQVHTSARVRQARIDSGRQRSAGGQSDSDLSNTAKMGCCNNR